MSGSRPTLFDALHALHLDAGEPSVRDIATGISRGGGHVGVGSAGRRGLEGGGRQGLPRSDPVPDRHCPGGLWWSPHSRTRELMHRMGHASMRAALIYQHATGERDREIAKGMDRRLTKATADPARKPGGGRKQGEAAHHRLLTPEWTARSRRSLRRATERLIKALTWPGG
jgi:hypothetical protein